MEKGSSTGLYILVAIVIFGIFIAMITGFLGQGVQAQVQGVVTFVEGFLSGEGNGGDDDVIIDEDEDDEEETPETPSNGYKGSKHKLNLTDEEIEAIVARIGFEPSKDLARSMLRNELTYDQLAHIQAGGSGDVWEQQGAQFLNNWLINEPFWYPQGVGETVQSTEPIISYANNIGDIVKNQRKPAAAQQELTDFYNYSMSYPEGSYERQYYERTVRQIGHGHGVQISADGKITGNWPSVE